MYSQVMLICFLFRMSRYDFFYFKSLFYAFLIFARFNLNLVFVWVITKRKVKKYLIITFYKCHKWGRSWRRGTKCDCKIDWLWVRSPLEEVKYLFTIIFSFLRSGVEAALSSITQHAMLPEFGGKSGTECLNTKFPLPTLLCAGYSVKLKKNYK